MTAGTQYAISPDELRVSSVAVRPGEITGSLVVDEGDPFFFDHTLDHVPGILLLTGLHDLFRAARVVQPDPWRLRNVMDVTFPSFADLDEMTTLSAIPSPLWRQPPHGYEIGGTVRAVQGVRPVCEGTVELFESRPMSRPVDGYLVDSMPAPAELVHRARSENVMIGTPVTGDGGVRVPVLQPSQSHMMARRGEDFRRTEELLEAARQFGTLLLLTAYDHAYDSKVILSRVNADLPCVVPRNWSLYLRCRPEPPLGHKHRLRIELVGREPHAEPLGVVQLEGTACSPEVYPRLRQRTSRR